MFPNSSLLQNEAGGPPAAPPPTPLPVLEPIASLPLRTSPDGSVTSPTLEFAPGGGTLNIVQQAGGGFWAHALWHAPTICAAGLLLSLALLATVVIRALRNRQRFGHFYCPRCNYDLTAPGGMPPDPGPCPECGADTARRPARLGRSFVSRAWKGIAAVTTLAVFCTLALFLTLEPAGAAAPWRRPWLEPLARIGVLPRLVRAQDSHFLNRMHVSVWSIPEGQLLASATAGGAGVFGCVTRDSTFFVWTQYGGPRGAVLQARNLATNVVQPIALPTDGPWNIVMVEPSPHPGRALIGYTNSLHRQSNEAVLAEVDPSRGTAEIIGQVPLSTADLSSGGRFVYRMIDGRMVWAYMIYSGGTGPAGTLSGRLITSSGRTYHFSVKGTWWHGPEMTADGLGVEVGAGGGGALDLKRIALADGAETAIPAITRNTNRADLPDGRSVALGAGAPLLRLQAADGSPLAEFKPSGTWLGAPVVSPDGRWAAAPIGHARKNWLGEEGYKVHVYVWDISSGR
jgi:hypothetical protein